MFAEVCMCVWSSLPLPVYDGAHVEANVLERSGGAFLHRVQVGGLIVQ